MKNWRQVVSISITLTFVTPTITTYLLGISDCTRLNVKTSDSCAVIFFWFFIGLQLLLIYDCEQQKIKAFL
jgi:hypothetical protein